MQTHRPSNTSYHTNTSGNTVISRPSVSGGGHFRSSPSIHPEQWKTTTTTSFFAAWHLAIKIYIYFFQLSRLMHQQIQTVRVNNDYKGNYSESEILLCGVWMGHFNTTVSFQHVFITAETNAQHHAQVINCGFKTIVSIMFDLMMVMLKPSSYGYQYPQSLMSVLASCFVRWHLQKYLQIPSPSSFNLAQKSVFFLTYTAPTSADGQRFFPRINCCCPPLPCNSS